LSELGIRPVAISVDTPEESKRLIEQMGYTFPFLSDQNLEATRKYDLLHAGAGANGRDISRPGEFLIDGSGVVRWVNLTSNYMVRARVEQIIEEAKKL
jgi:peroxiredoxin